MGDSKPTLEVVLAENRSAAHGQSQGSLFNVGRRLFRAVGTLFPDREYGRDIRAAVVLLDSLGTNINETVYVAAERGYDTQPYGRVVPLRETMSQYPILTGKHQYYEDAAKAEGAFAEISHDHQTESALAVPLWTPDSNMFGSLCIEGISGANGHFGEELAKPIQRIADLGALAIFYASQATVDAVTGLYSRRKLNEQLVREYQDAITRGKPLSVIMMDVDNFKSYNDHHGHLAGDKVLRFIGNTISEHFPNRFAGRYGGEEYVVLMPTEREDAIDHAELFRKKLERKSRDAGYNNGITASFGVASIDQIEAWLEYFGIEMSDDPRMRASKALDIADSAMYVGKGKDVQFWDGSGWSMEPLEVKKNRTVQWLSGNNIEPANDAAIRMVMRGKETPKPTFFKLAT